VAGRDEQCGIQRDYLDNAGRPVRLSEETVTVLRAALGEPDPSALARGPVVVRPGDVLHVPADGVQLADGSTVELRPGHPLELPLGYHWLHDADGTRRLIVSPGSCVLPARPAWGWTTQLYATRSRASWGIGDLADLARLGALAREQGAGFLLVNPLHAAAADQPSPYFPTSRRFFHPGYLAVAEVDGAGEMLGERLAAFAAAGRALNDDPRIDRAAVWRVKQEALRAVFDGTGAARSAGLARWRAGRGRAIEDFAAWSILADRYGGGWSSWPAGARHPDGPLARAVPGEQPDDVAFVAWLQWQLEQQLRAAGAAVPILQDLPIGVDPGGADAWAYQDTLALDVTVGAPQDPFNRNGQDWALPPFVPWRLQAAGYEPFIEAVRATMGLAGGLRIDHVMGLFRLWWIPAGAPATAGGYVRYPARDLLDIVALESVLANAPVVGEDLGTVEPGVREELAARNVLSYRLLWFEDDPPAQWPTKALAAVSTHDLPTVAGVWDGSDLADQRSSGVDVDEAAAGRLRALLVERAGVPSSAPVADAVQAAYRLLAQTPALLVAASLDDALAEPVRINIPGTVERANWTRALAVPLDDIGAHPGVRSIARTLRAGR
jgi:4-alpha-glucanotransferase